MRRVKKTTNEQFDLLKAEMAIHPAAARGYGVGAQRAVVDAEWKDIVEKLNALGPPERTMTEWKKVWSDLRLRRIKRLSDEFSPKPKRAKYKSKKIKLLEALCSSDSIYASYAENTEEKYLSPTNIHDESQHDAEESYENPLADDELHSTEKHFYNSSHDAHSYEVNSLEEEDTGEIYHNNPNNYNSDCPSPSDAVLAKLNQEKLHYLGQTMTSIEQQMKNQNKIMEHLTKMSSNLSKLMLMHVTNLEKQNIIMERQLRAMEYHNVFFRRQETRRKALTKRRLRNSQIS